MTSLSTTATVPDSLLKNIPIEQLQPSPTNPRKAFADADLEDLRASIIASGIQVPLLVREVERANGEAARLPLYEIVAGERRWRAAKALGMAELPCIVREMTDEQAREAQIIENLQRAGIHPLEEAEAFHELLGRLGSIAAVAQTVAKEQSYVAKCLRLLALTEDSKRSLLGKLITIEHALLLARLAEREQNAALKWTLDRNAGSKTPVEKVVAESEAQLGKKPQNAYYGAWEPESVKKLKAHIESESGIPLSRAPWKLDDAQLLPAAGACATCEKNTKANAPLFADLAIGVATCTDGACYGEKTAAFVQIAQMKAGQDVDAKPPTLVPRLSWKASTVKPAIVPNDFAVIIETPGRCGEAANPAKVLKQGQWVEAKKGSCPNVRPGVTADWSDAGQRGYGVSATKLRKPGETLLVCIAVGCKVHRKDWEKPKSSNGGSQERHDPAEHERKQKLRAQLEKEETAIRGKIFAVVLGGLDTAKAVHLVADDSPAAPAIRKQLLALFPKMGGEQLEALTLFYGRFERGMRANGYYLAEVTNGLAQDRKLLWAMAKKAGVDADAIVAQHFQDAGAVAPGLERLVPKGVKLPGAKKPDAKPAEKKAVAKVEPPAKKGAHAPRAKLTAEGRKRIAAQMKKRWASAKKSAAKKVAKKKAVKA